MKLIVGVLVSHRVTDLELSDLSLPMLISRRSPWVLDDYYSINPKHICMSEHPIYLRLKNK